MSGQTIYTARLRQALSLSDGTKHLEFEVEEMSHFKFIAGQFVSMKALKEDGREITRAYSIVSQPRNDNTFDVCLNRVQFGFFSNYLCDMEHGMRVKFHGPHGYFVPRNPIRDSVFVGTGTGVAPLRSMLLWLFEEPSRNQGHDFWLVFGTRYSPDLYYHEEFLRMQEEHRNFHYIPTLSRENAGWTGASGYVQEHVRKLAEGRTDMDAYICGLKDMVIANRDMLKELGWDKKSIMFERFD
jgi:ferredoxin-NADP reductase